MKRSIEEIREIGKKLLDELKEKGPDLSKVGKTVVHLKTNNRVSKTDEEYGLPCKTRELKK